MTEYMSKKTYTEYLSLQTTFVKVLETCAQEISMISNGRKLIGEFDGEVDLCGDGRYYVRFEVWSCGETEGDVVYVPHEYIYDEEYREYYKKVLIQEKEREAVVALQREEYRKANTYQVITDERATYERLKKKFGDG